MWGGWSTLMLFIHCLRSDLSAEDRSIPPDFFTSVVTTSELLGEKEPPVLFLGDNLGSIAPRSKSKAQRLKRLKLTEQLAASGISPRGGSVQLTELLMWHFCTSASKTFARSGRFPYNGAWPDDGNGE
jgi:hypothetical protein